MNFIPCIPKQLTPYNKHLVNKECIADYKDPKSLAKKLQDSKDYLGEPSMEIASNNQRLDLNKYKEESTVK